MDKRLSEVTSNLNFPVTPCVFSSPAITAAQAVAGDDFTLVRGVEIGEGEAEVHPAVTQQQSLPGLLHILLQGYSPVTCHPRTGKIVLLWREHAVSLSLQLKQLLLATARAMLLDGVQIV